MIFGFTTNLQLLKTKLRIDTISCEDVETHGFLCIFLKIKVIQRKLTGIKNRNILTISKKHIYKTKGVMVLLYEYLKENYVMGEPIFASDINIPDMTEENLRYHLKRLTDDGIICRFEPGIYYFPKTSILGEKMLLSADTVAVHKYIMRRGKRVGYYSGYTLANRMGLSTQVPFTEEITSNYAPAPVRELTIKNRKFIVRRPAVEITEENVMVLQFLDCLKDVDKCAEEELDICGQILTKYAKEHGITKVMIDKFIEKYPVKIYKAIYETGVEYVSARG